MSGIDNPDVHDLPRSGRNVAQRPEGRALSQGEYSENYRFVAIKKNAVFDMPADGPGENDFLEIAAFADEIFNGVAVGDADYVLLDDRTVVQNLSDVMAGCAD